MLMKKSMVETARVIRDYNMEVLTIEEVKRGGEGRIEREEHMD